MDITFTADEESSGQTNRTSIIMYYQQTTTDCSDWQIQHYLHVYCWQLLSSHSDWHEGCLTVHLPHEIMWNANLMQQGKFIDVFLAQHVPETCRAKNTSLKLPCCIKLAFHITSDWHFWHYLHAFCWQLSWTTLTDRSNITYMYIADSYCPATLTDRSKIVEE